MTTDSMGPWGDDPWDDDELDALLEDWAEVDRTAAAILRDAVPDVFAEPVPKNDMLAAATRFRDSIGSLRGDYFGEACAWSTLPDDDEELWYEAAQASLSPDNGPESHIEEVSAVMALEHADWLGIVLGLVRRGVGAPCTAQHATHDIRTCPEIEVEADDPDVDDEFGPTVALNTLVPLWYRLGILDDDDRLTALGRWGLPHALYDVWMSSTDGEAEDEPPE